MILSANNWRLKSQRPNTNLHEVNEEIDQFLLVHAIKEK
jgi:hypothetical protein